MSDSRANLSVSSVTERLVFGKADDDIITQGGFFTNKRDQKLFTRFWYPRDRENPRALAFVSHGFSEHLGNYHSIGDALAEDNILAFGHDHIGHGQSEGIPAYIESVDEYVDDLIYHCQAVRQNYCPTIPLFIVAHSMGGMVALRAALNYPKMFKGMILVGPLIIPGPQKGFLDFRVTSFRAVAARSVLGFLSWMNPELILGGVNMDLISRDDEVKQALSADDLRWSSGCKVRLLLAFVDCLEDNLNMMPNLQVPFLSLHGTADGLCNVLGSRLMKNCSLVEDKRIKEYEDAAHNLYMDLPEVRQDAIRETVQWIIDRSK